MTRTRLVSPTSFRAPSRTPSRSPRSLRRGFSLVELLLAVFILGIGIISIGAIFPAAIFQQRLANDDTLGPVVAENALAMLRTKLVPEMFGSDEQFGFATPLLSDIPGDFEWRRPSWIFDDPSLTLPGGQVLPRNSIVIFKPSGALLGDSTDSEIPWNPEHRFVNLLNGLSFAYGVNPTNPLEHLIAFTPAERSYPLVAAGATAPSGPQYRWECAFRRFQGKVQVAIFVFRVTRTGGERGVYRVNRNQAPLDTAAPPLPLRVDTNLFPAFQPWTAGGTDGNVTSLADNTEVLGTAAGLAFDAADPRYDWQSSGQWILDNNNNIHRIQRGRGEIAQGPVLLARPVPFLPDIPAYPRSPGAAAGSPPRVEAIWFMPARDSAGNTLTPVFVTVKEL